MQREFQAHAAYRPPHRRGAAVLVLALHLLLLAGLWQAMRTRVVEVMPPQRSLTWVRALPAAPAATPPAAAERPARQSPRPSPPPMPPRRADEPRATAPPPRTELTWVEPTPAVATAAAAPASAASAPPERLLDTAATRAALRALGRQPLLHEQAAESTGTVIARTDTALARDVAEAGTPDCLRDGKAASGQIGPVGLGGILGLPFLAARVATGKCAK
jgi:hypothetical protein